MAELPPVNYHRPSHKHNVTRIEICDSGNTYIVILSKVQNRTKTRAVNPVQDNALKNQENPCCKSDNINILVNRRKKDKERKRNKHRTHFITTDEYLKILAKKRSTPDVHVNVQNKRSMKKQHSDTYLKSSTYFRTQCIINTVTLHPTKVPEDCLPLLRHPLVQAQLRIYRHHFSEKDETCLRCHSMTNLIKTLYNNHKQKQFHKFDYFQCGHLELKEQLLSKPCKIPEKQGNGKYDSVFIDTFTATKMSEQKMKKTEITNVDTLQKENTFDYVTNGKEIPESNVTKISEIEVREAEDSTCIGTFVATKSSEQKMEKVVNTNLKTMLIEGPINNARNCIQISKCNTTNIPEIEVRETQDSVCAETFAAAEMSEKKMEKVVTTNLETMQKVQPINYATNCLDIPAYNATKIPQIEVRETQDSVCTDTLAATKMAEQKMEKVVTTNLETMQKEQPIKYATNGLEIPAYNATKIPKIEVRETQDTVCTETFSATKMVEQKMEKVVTTNLETMQKEQPIKYATNGLEIPAYNATKIPKIEVRETQDSVCTETFAATKMVEQKMEKVVTTNLETKQKEQPIKYATNSLEIPAYNATKIPKTEVRETQDSLCTETFAATKMVEQKMEKVITTNLETMQKVQPIKYATNGLEIPAYNATSIPQIEVRETQDSVCTETFAATKMAEQKIEKVVTTNIETMQKEQQINYATNCLKIPAHNATKLPEIEVRETQDSVCNQTFAAVKISEQKMEKVVFPNLDTLQKEETNDYTTSCIVIPINNAITGIIENEISMKHNRDNILAKCKITTSELLYKNKSITKTNDTLHRVLSFSDIMLLSRNIGLIDPSINTIKKGFFFPRDLLSLAAKEYCCEAQEKKVGIIKSERCHPRQMSAQAKLKTTVKKVTSKIFNKTRGVRSLISLEKLSERKEQMDLRFNKHCYSLQDLKTMSIKLHKALKEKITSGTKEINPAELENATRSEKAIGNYISKVHLNSPPMIKNTTVDKTDESIKTSKDQINTTAVGEAFNLDLSPKEKKKRFIPKPMNKSTPGKKDVEMKKDDRIGTLISSKTTSSKAGYTKRQTMTSPLNRKSQLQNEKILRFQNGDTLKNSKPVSSVKDQLKTEVVNKQKDHKTLTKSKDIDIKPNVKSAKVIRSSDTLYSVFRSAAKQSKSQLDKTLLNKTQRNQPLLKHKIQANKKGVMKKADESSTSWDQVLTNKIRERETRDVLADIKNRDDYAVPSFIAPKTENNRNQTNNLAYASKFNGNHNPSALPKTVEEKRNEPKVQSLKQSTPLDGKSTLEKEKILRALLRKGKSLPEGRTKTEKALIDKIKTETKVRKF